MDKVKIGIIGAGRIGRVHAENIVQRISGALVTSIVDVRPEVAREVADRFGIEKAGEDYTELIQDREVDAVLICSSTDTHIDIISRAAAAGKHIFCEKPIDLSIEKIKTALKVVEDAGVKFMVGFNRRFDPNFLKLREMVREGHIGEPHLLRISSRDPAPPPAGYSKVSGGIFMDMTIHDFDMARYLSGSEVTEVYGKAAVRIDPEIGMLGDYDTAMITLTLENGVVCSIDNSRRAVYGYDQRAEVFGSGGMVSTENNTPDNHYYMNESRRHSALPLHFFMQRYTQSYITEMLAFVEAVAGDKAVSVGGTDGLEAARIALAVKKSVLENRPVCLNEEEQDR